MKHLIKELLREELNEISFKNAVAGGLMTLGSLGGAKAQTAPEPTPTTQTTTPATAPKPMYGTPEQRAAAKAKREANRKKNFDIFVNNAYGMGFFEEIDEEEFNNSCNIANNEEINYLNGSSPELPNLVYREMEDGIKIKIDIRKYQKYLKKQNKQGDVPLDGLQAPNFKSTKCGISKAGAKQSKKDWAKK
jgi:hypothetical protein